MGESSSGSERGSEYSSKVNTSSGLEQSLIILDYETVFLVYCRRWSMGLSSLVRRSWTWNTPLDSKLV